MVSTLVGMGSVGPNQGFMGPQPRFHGAHLFDSGAVGRCFIDVHGQDCDILVTS